MCISLRKTLHAYSGHRRELLALSKRWQVGEELARLHIIEESLHELIVTDGSGAHLHVRTRPRTESAHLEVGKPVCSNSRERAEGYAGAQEGE